MSVYKQAEADLFQKKLAAMEDARLKEAEELARKNKEVQEEWQRLQVSAFTHMTHANVFVCVCVCVCVSCKGG